MQRLIIPILLGLAVLGLAGLVWFPSIAQPQWYHDFADQRSVLGIANFWNVISNFPFVFIGGLGIWHVARGSTRWQIDSSDRWMYLSFFAAVALMGVGSDLGARLVSLDCSAPVVSRFRRPTFRIGYCELLECHFQFSFRLYRRPGNLARSAGKYKVANRF